MQPPGSDAPRTVQFLVERSPCGRAWDPNVKLPLCVWIYPAELKGYIVNRNCDGKCFLMVRPFRMIAKDGTSYTAVEATGHTPAVCEHMGQVIE